VNQDKPEDSSELPQAVEKIGRKKRREGEGRGGGEGRKERGKKERKKGKEKRYAFVNVRTSSQSPLLRNALRFAVTIFFDRFEENSRERSRLSYKE